METGLDKKRRLVFVLSIPASALIVLPVYIILHEAGHTLVASLCGAAIVDYNLFDSYMTYRGGSFTPFTASLLNAAGMLTPVVGAFAFMAFHRKGVSGAFSRVFSFFVCALPIFSILAWVVVPIQYMAGTALSGDDVTQFIYNSGLHPLLVSLFALLLFAGSMAVMFLSGVIPDFIDGAKDLVREAEGK